MTKSPLPSRNTPQRSPWQKVFPWPTKETQKYSRGTGLIRGGGAMMGAARLSARAAQRIGAGMITLAVPKDNLDVYATSLWSAIVKPCDDLNTWRSELSDKRHTAFLIGPGLGIGAREKAEVEAVLKIKQPCVLDAGALTNFADNPQSFFDHTHSRCVLTPHEGEFERLFGTLAGDKVARSLEAARRAQCVVVLKGSDTVIAAPDGKAMINKSAPAWLATAGSGDVLAGMILGLIAQKMPVFEAAQAAVWIHAKIAHLHGPGLIAEDIVEGIPGLLLEILQA